MTCNVGKDRQSNKRYNMGTIVVINDIKFKRLDTRLLEWLTGQNKKTIEITHEQLAQELGSSRVVISRLLKDLERKNILSLGRAKIELK